MRQCCSICGKEFEGYGNNAYPVNNGRCCNNCNFLIVVTRRMQDYTNKQKKKEGEK
ncbi:MAG: hypothetical protein HFJ59_06975 [Clostridia bacterium]|nr:hypothetical protein [Clostridia bacterium]